MSTPFHNKVSHVGYDFPESMITWYLDTGITAADIGKPMSIKTGVNKTAKIAADGKRIMGELKSVELRSGGVLVGTIAHSFSAQFNIKAADTLAVGDGVVGAGNGEVRKWVTNDEVDTEATVTDVTSGVATIIKF